MLKCRWPGGNESIFEEINASRENNDLDAWVSLLHEDYTFVRHQSNTTL